MATPTQARIERGRGSLFHAVEAPPRMATLVARVAARDLRMVRFLLELSSETRGDAERAAAGERRRERNGGRPRKTGRARRGGALGGRPREEQVYGRCASHHPRS